MVNLRQRRVSNHNGKVQKGSFYLPPEIICEILSRLPVESILRCRSVCKEWCRLTRDPQFINLQLNRVNNQLPRVILKSHYKVDLQSLLLLDTEGCNIRKIPFKKMQLPSSPKFRMSDLRLMSSCDGLLCIAVDYRIHPVIILNPITRDSVILPSQKRRMYVGSSFEMITVGENSWRTLSAPPVPIEENLGAAVYWNGAFHWKIEEKNNKGGDKCILGFNISDETFYTISCHVKFGTSEYDLLVLGGYLSLVEHDVHLMRIWKVSGTKDEGFYLSHRCTYNTYVRWNKFLCYSVISQTVPDRFLLKLSQDDGKGDGNDSFVQFYPEKAFYSYLDIPGLPIHFRSVHFKPTFVSPRAASLGFS
uniref:F-box domain-containing protein n=1 Tax=Fagus sylvatica TaxID=28930 RepID=A0A2N9ITQ9_FAGSY